MCHEAATVSGPFTVSILRTCARRPTPSDVRIATPGSVGFIRDCHVIETVYHRHMADATLSRPELRAHEHAMRSTLEATVKELADLLTPRLVAYIGGVRETRAVHQWAEGTREIKSPEVEDRLRFALQVAVLLAEHDSPRVVQAWFQGLNPHLEDRSPARLLREGDLVEVGPAVLGAARAFLIGG